MEGGGPGIAYTMNYERIFGDFSARVGAGYFAGSGLVDIELLSVPVTLNYLGIRSGAHIFELGAGMTFYQSNSGVSGFHVMPSGAAQGNSFLIGTAVAGYRYQPEAAGLFFRAGATAIFSIDTIFPLPHLALGGAF